MCAPNFSHRRQNMKIIFNAVGKNAIQTHSFVDAVPNIHLWLMPFFLLSWYGRNCRAFRNHYSLSLTFITHVSILIIIFTFIRYKPKNGELGETECWTSAIYALPFELTQHETFGAVIDVAGAWITHCISKANNSKIQIIKTIWNQLETIEIYPVALEVRKVCVLLSQHSCMRLIGSKSIHGISNSLLCTRWKCVSHITFRALSLSLFLSQSSILPLYL